MAAARYGAVRSLPSPPRPAPPAGNGPALTALGPRPLRPPLRSLRTAPGSPGPGRDRTGHPRMRRRRHLPSPRAGPASAPPRLPPPWQRGGRHAPSRRPGNAGRGPCLSHSAPLRAGGGLCTAGTPEPPPGPSEAPGTFGLLPAPCDTLEKPQSPPPRPPSGSQDTQSPLHLAPPSPAPHPRPTDTPPTLHTLHPCLCVCVRVCVCASCVCAHMCPRPQCHSRGEPGRGLQAASGAAVVAACRRLNPGHPAGVGGLTRCVCARTRLYARTRVYSCTHVRWAARCSPGRMRLPLPRQPLTPLPPRQHPATLGGGGI